MKKNTKAGKIALSLAIAAAVTVSTGTLFKVNADPSQIDGFTLPGTDEFTDYNSNGVYSLNVNPGSDATSLGFSWFSQNKGTAQLKIALASELQNGSLPSSAKTLDATRSTVTATVGGINTPTTGNTVPGGSDGRALTDEDGEDGSEYNFDYLKNNGVVNEQATGEYSYQVTATSLQPGTQYAYQVSDANGNWSAVYKISTLKSDSVTFAAFGDPQIGAFEGTNTKSQMAHSNVADDESGWDKMLQLVTGQSQKFDFLFTMGDEVNDYSSLDFVKNGVNDGQWWQYNYFFNPKGNTTLQTTPLAAFSGNHDHQLGKYYGFHYNQPNRSPLGATQYGNDGDYWFTAGPVLFLVLDANNYGTSEHDQFIKEAIADYKDAHNGAEPQWKVAAWHQSAYSEANHSTANLQLDPVETIRNTWPKMMEDNKIDVVLQGHDHFYTRTAQMLDGNAIDPDTGAIDDDTWYDTTNLNTGATATDPNPNTTTAFKNYPNSVTDPKGIVYFTLDSGSGSKYYNWNTGLDHTYSVKSWQGYVPTYSNVSFTNNQFTIHTYAVDTNYANPTEIDSYTINKTTNTNPGGDNNDNGNGDTETKTDPTKTADATVGDGSTTATYIPANNTDVAALSDTQNVAFKLANATLNVPKEALDYLLEKNDATADGVSITQKDVALSSLPTLGTGYTAAVAAEFDLTNATTGEAFTVKDFGSDIQVTWTISKDKAASISDQRQLFRVNDDGTIDKLDATFTKNSDGSLTVVFLTKHFSQFVVANMTTTPSSSTPSSSDTSASNPHTGSAQDALVNAASIAAVVLMLGGAAFVVLRKKKRV